MKEDSGLILKRQSQKRLYVLLTVEREKLS